nr:uncharacterized protein LOC105336104 isoform X2 [Crassostrea gigas]
MDIRPLLLDIMICLDVSLSVWDSTERPFTDRKDGPCCDGTLAFAAPPTMPCSSFQCCQSVEDVVVYPVNHALGYEFRCIFSLTFIFFTAEKGNYNQVLRRK